MKKQIIQIFHNMIHIEKKPALQNMRETWKGIEQGSEAGAQAGAVETVSAEQSDITIVKSTSDKVTERKSFEKIVDDMICGGQEQGCMLIVDLDRFKDINGIYGRDTGDAVLQRVTDILNSHFEECACIGRTGGDVFALWIPGLSGEDADYIRRQVGRLNDRLLHPEKDLPPVSVSVGVAFYEDGDDCRKLGKRASKMLYRVKESGRCGCEIEMAS